MRVTLVTLTKAFRWSGGGGESVTTLKDVSSPDNTFKDFSYKRKYKNGALTEDAWGLWRAVFKMKEIMSVF